MKHQRNSHEPRQYFTNSLCLLCRGWSSFAEYFCRSGKQVDLDGVTYLLVYSRLVFHPSISSLGLTEGHEYTAISLIMRKAFNVRVLQGVLQRRRELRHLRGCWFNASPRGSPGLLPWPPALAATPPSTESRIRPAGGPADAALAGSASLPASADPQSGPSASTSLPFARGARHPHSTFCPGVC